MYHAFRHFIAILVDSLNPLLATLPPSLPNTLSNYVTKFSASSNIGETHRRSWK